MCSPTIALGVASLGMQLMGSMQQAQAAQDQADYEAAVQRNNNIMAERARKDAIKRGKREETLRRLQIGQDKATARSQLAGGGFDVNTGSALTRQSDVEAMGEVEALTIRNNAQREAYGISVDNARERAASAGRIASFENKRKSSLISGATQVISGGYGMARDGVFS